MNERVSVIGLGKLGLGLALCFADADIETVGIDVNESVVNSLNSGVTPVIEPRYQELITKTRSKFRADTDHAAAIEGTDVSFILVATPSVGDGRFSNRYIKSAL